MVIRFSLVLSGFIEFCRKINIILKSVVNSYYSEKIKVEIYIGMNWMSQENWKNYFFIEIKIQAI
jgi:hypothetical protein